MRQLIFALSILIATSMQAAWFDYPVNANTFSGNGTLRWTVDLSQNGSSMSYEVADGDELKINIAIVSTDLVGLGGALLIKLPPGLIAARYVVTTGMVSGLNSHRDTENNPGEPTQVAIAVGPGDDEIYISPWNGWYNCGHGEPYQIGVFGQISIPLKK